MQRLGLVLVLMAGVAAQEKEERDPWLVADELCTQGKLAEAAAFAAKLPPGKDTEALAAYVKSPGAARTVLGHMKRGMELRGQRKHEEAARAFGRAAAEARKIGWLQKAADAYYQAAVSAQQRGNPAAAVEWIKKNLEVHRHRESPVGEGTALGGLGGLYSDLGRGTEAVSLLEAALGLLEPHAATDPKAAMGAAAALVNLGRAQRNLGYLHRAVATQERARDRLEKLENKPYLAWAVYNVGETDWYRGEFERALSSLERAEALMLEIGDIRGQSYALIRLGDSLREVGRPKEALAKLERALQLAERARARWAIAKAHQLLGTYYTNQGPYSKAIPHQEQALERLRAIGDRVSEVYIWCEMAAACRTIGRLEQAREALGKAIEFAETIEGSLARAGALRTIGFLLKNLRQYDRALEYLHRALGIYEKLENHSNLADTLSKLALTNADAGLHAESLPFFERALRIREEQKNARAQSWLLQKIGAAHSVLGDRETAVRFIERGVEVARKSGDRDSEARALMALCLAHKRGGDLRVALRLGERFVRVARETPYRDLHASALAELADIYRLTGEGKRALELLEECLRLREELDYRSGVSSSLTMIGVQLWDMGDYNGARGYMERALRISQALGDRRAEAGARSNLGVVLGELGENEAGTRHVEIAYGIRTSLGLDQALWDLANLAAFEIREGKHEEAAPKFERILVEAERMGYPDLLRRAYNGLIRCARERGDHREAVAAARKAVATVQLIARGLGDEQGAAMRSRVGHRKAYVYGSEAALALKSAPDMSFFLESGRAGVLLEALGGRDRMRSAVLPKELQDAERAAHAAVVAARARAGSGKRADARAEADAREKLARVVEQIQREAKSAGNVLYGQVAPLAEIQACLGPGQALVLYDLNWAPHALVVLRDGARGVRLAKHSRIRAACAALAIDKKGTGWQDRVAALRELVVDPLELPASVTQVLVSPDGPLSFVPMGLLTEPREVAYVPSGTTYTLLRADKEKRGTQVLAVGDPTRGPETGLRGRELGALPGSRAEARSVGEVTLLGDAATKSGLRKALQRQPRWRAVHFACHGLVNTERAMLSGLVLAPEKDNAGLLTCIDLYRMEIPADLAVLSACETARGRVYRAEGIVGLTRSFFFAGTPRVIVSLWKVDDQATRALMVKFYELWKPGKLSTAAALKAAQAHVRAQPQWRHPYFWAAWQLWGLPD